MIDNSPIDYNFRSEMCSTLRVYPPVSEVVCTNSIGNIVLQSVTLNILNFNNLVAHKIGLMM